MASCQGLGEVHRPEPPSAVCVPAGLLPPYGACGSRSGPATALRPPHLQAPLAISKTPTSH